MSGSNLHNALLRPPIIQILRAAGFHATRPSVLDTLADLTAQYIMILASSATTHAANAHPHDPVPVLEDIYQALQDAGALRPQLREWEEDWQGEEDMRGLEGFLSWFTGPANREIRRIAGFVPSEGDMVDADALEKEDFLTALKKKHSKTGEESRYAGTVLGKNADEHPIIIEGGAPSLQDWGSQMRSRAPYMADSDSSGTFLTSSTHPSLPQAATTARHALRQALKAHKRLPRGPQQDAHLQTLLTTITSYLPYLLALSNGLSSKPGDTSPTEEIEITLRTEIISAWRPTLTNPTTTLSLKQRPTTTRIQGQGLDFEIAFVLSTLSYVLNSLARIGVTRTLYASATPTPEQRTAAIQTATKHLLQASAVHSLLASSPSFATAAHSICNNKNGTSTLPDLDPATQAALSCLALAEATLLAVLKDDSYVAACIQARNPNDKDWMVRAPEIPKVRAHLFARLCIRAAEYAEQAAAGLGSVRSEGRMGIDDDLLGYTRVLGRVARARACRFFGVDAELSGKIGEGIAWLRAAKGALGVRGAGTAAAETKETNTKSRTGLSRLKQGWMERREERRMEKDAGSRDRTEKGELGPGDNAGREEESRVIEMLETKWVRMNDTINTQLIPPSTDLLANLPSGRDIHSAPAPYKIPSLDEEQLVRMRAPPVEDDFGPGSDVEDSDEEAASVARVYTPGTVPERSDSAYY
ncbi:hypothetical protein CAN33_0013095 [Aspergillus niger]|uniref:pH-response regulator protein palC n=1 Tax=Aspergillus niger TaxID=5061 RepID=A0A505HTQ2_ASPNG|nr:hypothetical protein CAN33_0013095 [Aspergillus niger]